MAIADDISVAVNGDIRYTGTTDTYTVLELHRFLQDLADNASSSGDDLIDITSETPSDRAFDTIITLNAPYNIDDTLAESLYGGSITQDGGDTVYSGLQILGSVNNANTQIEIVQDGALYDAPTPFWGDQSTGGLNGDSVAGILLRILVKTRVSGADIDGKRIRCQARHWGDTYDFFNATLGVGEGTAALSTTPDAQNDTLQGTVTAYTHVTNTEGFQTIDLNNGNGAREYYSAWTYGADTSGDGLKGMWEFIKDLTGNGTAKTIHGLNGEFFLGITHSMAYDNEAGGPFTEDEILAWGTSFAYDNEASGPFTLGEYVTIGSSGAAGKLVHLDDQGTTGTIYVALEDTSITLLDDDVITGITSGATADINGAITANGSNGGTGVLLALDDDGATGNVYIQVLSGVAPADDQVIIGQTSDATADVNGTPTARTVPKIFLGSYTGSLIGAYGIGVVSGDLTASDSIQDLSATTQVPPNNVTFTVSGLISGQDRILVGPEDGSGGLDLDQLSLNTTLNGAAETAVVTTAAIPTDTPATGTIRIQLDTGIYRLVSYTSYTGSTFTIGSTDFTGGNVATAANNVFVSYIDKLAAATNEAFTTVFSSSRTLFIRVRDGGASPIKTFETTGTLGTAGGSATASRVSDA